MPFMRQTLSARPQKAQCFAKSKAVAGIGDNARESCDSAAVECAAAKRQAYGVRSTRISSAAKHSMTYWLACAEPTKASWRPSGGLNCEHEFSCPPALSRTYGHSRRRCAVRESDVCIWGIPSTKIYAAPRQLRRLPLYELRGRSHRRLPARTADACHSSNTMASHKPGTGREVE